MSNELLNLERLALCRIAHQVYGFLRAVSDAHPTAHTGSEVYHGVIVIQRQRRKLAKLDASPTGSTQIDVHLGHIAGRSQHRRAVLVGVHGAAAAGAAVTDGVEATEHSIFVLVDTINKILSL
jgi:hypothetical protein